MIQWMSIIEAVEDLNDDIFLPGIQREFVWDTLPARQRLILDGQLQLIAFSIGLQGTYTEKQIFFQCKNPDAWNQKQLPFN